MCTLTSFRATVGPPLIDLQAELQHLRALPALIQTQVRLGPLFNDWPACQIFWPRSNLRSRIKCCELGMIATRVRNMKFASLSFSMHKWHVVLSQIEALRGESSAAVMKVLINGLEAAQV